MLESEEEKNGLSYAFASSSVDDIVLPLQRSDSSVSSVCEALDTGVV